jgi:hypothetical protein
MIPLHHTCNAPLRNKPGQRCRRTPLAGRTRCALHGGIPRGETTRDDARKPGPKPRRDPAASERRKGRAALFRTDPALAATIPVLLAAPGPKPSPAPEPPSLLPSITRPPWPRGGYTGGLDARRTEKDEREFMQELSRPLRLDHLSLADLDRLIAAERSRLGQLLANYRSQEQLHRRDGADAIAARLDRLEWEISGYLDRLGIARSLVAARAERHAAEERERAGVLTAAVKLAGLTSGGAFAAPSVEPTHVQHFLVRKHVQPLLTDHAAK